MPAGMRLVRMLLVVTLVPCLVGMKTSGVQVGMFMCPGVGGAVDGGSTGIRSQAGFEAPWSPCRWRVTVLSNASLRLTTKFGPVIGRSVVVGTTNAEGGAIAKSGICWTVPLYMARWCQSPTA